MVCNLTQEDCAEIYHALGCLHVANLQARIGYDGEMLMRGEANLFKGDAQLIHRALIEERGRVLEGAYDSYPGEVKQDGSVTFKLVQRIDHILDEIGNRGDKLKVALRTSKV